MKRYGNPLISFAAPFLILIAFFGILHREGDDRLRSLPALIVGSGLVGAGVIRRSRRRKMLLMEIKNSKSAEKF